MIGVTMTVMATSFKRTHASMPQLPGLLYLVPLTLQHAAVDPCLCQRLLDTGLSTEELMLLDCGVGEDS